MIQFKYTYSFRAECQVDVDRFHALVQSKSLGVAAEASPAGIAPDVLVTLMSNASLEEIRALMSEVEDGHVMAETLRAVPLNENSLERERMRP